MSHIRIFCEVVPIPSCCADTLHENKGQTMHKAKSSTISSMRLDVHQPLWHYTVREICNHSKQERLSSMNDPCFRGTKKTERNTQSKTLGLVIGT